MSMGVALVLMVLIIGVCSVWVQHIQNRRHHGDALSDQQRRALEEERDRARSELGELRERVKVLERIATDPAQRTAEQIEKLRDE